jgi:hypothetical protein
LSHLLAEAQVRVAPPGLRDPPAQEVEAHDDGASVGEKRGDMTRAVAKIGD